MADLVANSPPREKKIFFLHLGSRCVYNPSQCLGRFAGVLCSKQTEVINAAVGDNSKPR
jgi:hypothetical protein